MNINDRIKEIRKILKLSQTAFGERLGVGRGVITNLEMNLTEPKDLFIDLLCSTFKVSRKWLETGTGDMFTAAPENIVDKLIKEYNLDDVDASIIKSYLSLTEAERATVKKYITNITNNISSQPSREDIIKADMAATNKKLSAISIKNNIE